MLIAEDETRVLVAPQHLVAESRHEFRRAALEHLERVARCGATRLVVDMRHTKEIDASGLGVLVLLQKRGRDLMIATKLLHAPVAVKQMLELTKLDYLFEIEG